METYKVGNESQKGLEDIGNALFAARSNIDKGIGTVGFSDCPCPCPPIASAVLYVTFSPIM